MFIENGFFKRRTPAPEERNKDPSTDFTDYTDSEKMRYQSRYQLKDCDHLAPAGLENAGCRFYRHHAPNRALETEQ